MNYASPESVMRDLGGVSEIHRGRPDSGAKPTRGRAFGRLLVLGIADLETSIPRDYYLKGLISPGETSIWVGPPKCGKSFLLLHVAYLLSLGRSVFGRRAKKATVLYVAAEGEGGIANRIRALRDRHGSSADFHFIAQPADLLHADGHLGDLEKAALACGAQLIVLDTLSRMMAGGDENSSTDMGSFIRNVAELRHLSGAHVAIVHHGTQATGGAKPRGHGSLTGADDALIEVAKLADGTRTATIIHAKDDADGDRFGFKLEPTSLGTDPDGDPITTLTVTELTEPGEAPGKAVRLTDNEQIALTCLDRAIAAEAVLATVGDNFEERRVATAASWRAWFYQKGKPDESQDTRLKAFTRARDGLIAKGRVACQDSFVWRPEVW